MSYANTVSTLVAGYQAGDLTNQEKIDLIDDLNEFLVGNPAYEDLLALVPLEANTAIQTLLTDHIYTFSTTPGQGEIDLFGYVNPGYILNNPGIQGNQYSSYVGVYFSDEGEQT